VWERRQIHVPVQGGGLPAVVCRAASLQPLTRESEKMPEGKIKRLTDRGFGFIDVGKEKDLFFHSSSVQGTTFDQLREGQKVTFTEGRGPKGPCAENVTPA
jgi:CspA family cold shock protein